MQASTDTCVDRASRNCKGEWGLLVWVHRKFHPQVILYAPATNSSSNLESFGLRQQRKGPTELLEKCSQHWFTCTFQELFWFRWISLWLLTCLNSISATLQVLVTHLIPGLNSVELHLLGKVQKWFMPPPTCHKVNCHTTYKSHKLKTPVPSSKGGLFQC